MATTPIDLSAGLVPKQSGGIDLSAGLVPKDGTGQVPPTTPGALDPRGGWNPLDIARGAVTGIKQIVAHPIDTIAGMAQPLMAAGVSPNGYPSTAATGRPEDSQANAQVQQAAQQGQAQAAQQIKQNPAYAVGAIAGPALATAGIAKVAPLVGDAAASVTPSAMRESAGGLLQSVAHDANKVPVSLDNAGDAALDLMDWQKKTTLGPTVNKFLNRITNPKLGPLTYEEGRDFYQLLGSLSADDTMKIAPPVRRTLTQMVVGLKQDLGNAADTVGRAADYYQGLGDYAKAQSLQEWYDLAKKYAVRGGLAAAGAAGVGTAAHFITEGMSQ